MRGIPTTTSTVSMLCQEFQYTDCQRNAFGLLIRVKHIGCKVRKCRKHAKNAPSLIYYCSFNLYTQKQQTQYSGQFIFIAHLQTLVMSEWLRRSHSEILKTKSPYPDQRLPQHESLHHIALKAGSIEITYIGSHYIDFSKTDFYYIIQKQIYSNYIQTHFS